MEMHFESSDGAVFSFCFLKKIMRLKAVQQPQVKDVYGGKD